MLDDSSALKAEPEAIQFHGEALARDVWARTYGVWIVAGFVAIFACFLIAMNLAGQVPGKSFALKSISDVFQFVGEGIGCFFCVRIALRLRKVFIQLRRELMAKEIGRVPTTNLETDRAERQAAYRGYLAWTFLAIAIALYVAGQIIWTSYDMRMNSADVPSQCTAKLRAIFLGLLHVYAGQTNQWRNLRSSLDSNSKLIRHLRETLSKIRYSKLFSQSDQQLNAEGVVLDLAISEATILEQQHQHVVDQVPRTTSTTAKMAGLNNISQSGK